MRRSSTSVDDFCDHVGFVLRPVLSEAEGLSPKGGRPARSALTGAIEIAELRKRQNDDLGSAAGGVLLHLHVGLEDLADAFLTQHLGRAAVGGHLSLI